MILTIPYTELQIQNIRLYPKTVDRRSRVLYPLGYTHESIQLSDVAIMTPPLTFVSYDVTTGRLIFECNRQLQKGFIGKLVAIQVRLQRKLLLILCLVR